MILINSAYFIVDQAFIVLWIVQVAGKGTGVSVKFVQSPIFGAASVVGKRTASTNPEGSLPVFINYANLVIADASRFIFMVAEMNKFVCLRVILIQASMGAYPKGSLIISQYSGNSIITKTFRVIRIMLKMGKDIAFRVEPVEPLT